MVETPVGDAMLVQVSEAGYVSALCAVEATNEVCSELPFRCLFEWLCCVCFRFGFR